MTIAKSWDLQAAVFNAVSAALDPVPVTTSVPRDPEARYCRIDGFSMAANRAHKNQAQGDHSFTIHVFDAPEGGTSSLAWARQQIAAAHAAVEGLKLDASSHPIRLGTAAAALDNREDGVTDAHAFARYTATIGD